MKFTFNVCIALCFCIYTITIDRIKYSKIELGNKERLILFKNKRKNDNRNSDLRAFILKFLFISFQIFIFIFNVFHFILKWNLRCYKLFSLLIKIIVNAFLLSYFIFHTGKLKIALNFPFI